MSVLEITPARVLDAGSLGRILSENNDLLPWLPRVHSAAEEIMYAEQMIEAGWVAVARRDREVVGFIARWDNEIVALYVLPEEHDKGIGTALLDHAKDTCSQLGLWSYQANSAATRFYNLRDFKEVARTDGSSNDVGLADIRFEWSREAE